MFTKSAFLAALLLLTVCPAAQPAFAWESDWALDTALNATAPVVRRPMILPLGDGKQRGAPETGSFPYKQQPAVAQLDFRGLSLIAPTGMTGSNTTIAGIPDGAGNSSGSSPAETTGITTTSLDGADNMPGQNDSPDQDNNGSGNMISGAQIPLPDLSGDDPPLGSPTLPF